MGMLEISKGIIHKVALAMTAQEKYFNA